MDSVDEGYLLTTDNDKVLPNEKLPLHPKLQITKLWTLDYRTIISRIKGKRKSGVHFSEDDKTGKFSQFLIKIQRSFPFNILMAEGSIFYILSGYWKGRRLIKKNNIDTMYSSFMPYADHIIAYLLKRRFPKVRWVADFRDLHVEPIYKNTLWPEWQKSIERRLLSGASAVTTVSEGLTTKMKDIHPNVHTITKGVQLRTKEGKFEKFTICYSGSLFLDFRDPESILENLHLLMQEGELDTSNFQFIYAGKDGAKMKSWIKKYHLEDVYHDLGYVSHGDVKKIQSRSHINLLLTSVSEEHSGLLTGKFFEYIEAGNAIVCVINGRDQEIESIFERYRLGYVFNSAISGNQLASLRIMIQEWKSTGDLDWKSDKILIEKELSWQVQSKKLLDII
jgi:hypothetical protein